MPSNHLVLCHPLFLLPSVFPSIRVSLNESALHIRWAKFEVSASTSVLPVNIQEWFPLGWTGWISLLSKELSGVFSSTTTGKHQFFGAQPSLWSSSHICTWLLENHVALTIQTFVTKVMSLLLNMLSRFVIAFLPRSKYLLISMTVVTICGDFGAREDKVCHYFHCFPTICHEVMGPDAMIFLFWLLSFKPALLLSSSIFIKRLFPVHFLPSWWCHLHIWGYWYFSWQSWLQLVLHPAWHFTWCTLHMN